MSGGGPDAPRDQLMQEAAAWFARMRGPDADASREEFESWLRRGALHRQAYNRATEIFAMGKLLAEDDVKPGQTTAGREKRHRPGRRLLAATAGLLVLALAGWLALKMLSSDPPGAVEIAQEGPGRALQSELLSTPAGHGRMIVLPEGSIIALDGDTELEVRLGPAERILDLRRGQARFQVYHEPRPFVVHAGGGTVTAHGTVFDVSIGQDRHVTVHLIAGAVDVVSAGALVRGQRQMTRLRPGQTLSYLALSPQPGANRMPRGSNEYLAPGSPAQGAREYEEVKVADLIAAANRGSGLPVRLADPAIGERRVSGRFRLDDTLLLAQRLALLFALRVDRSHVGEIVLRAR